MSFLLFAGQGDGPPIEWQYMFGQSWLVFVSENGGINLVLLFLALRQAWCLRCKGCRRSGDQGRKRWCGCFDFRSFCLTMLSLALCGEFGFPTPPASQAPDELS